MAKAEPIKEGDIFGNLKVLRRTKNLGSGKIYYECLILNSKNEDNIVELRADKLRSITDDHPYCKFEDAINIGSSYSNIKVLSLHHNDKGRKYFNCTCNECCELDKCIFVLRSDYVKANRKSKYYCKTERPREVEDLTGKVFGDLEVISLDHIQHGKGSFWKCKCHGICGGNEIVVSRGNLMNPDGPRQCRDCYLASIAANRNINPIGYKVIIDGEEYTVEKISNKSEYICTNTSTNEEKVFSIEKVRISLLRPKEYSYYRNNKASISDGDILDNFYVTWRNIKSRVLDIDNISYDRYGKRNIRICPEWLIYENFYNDMYESYLEHVAMYGLNDTSIDRINNDDDYCKENCRWATNEEQAHNKENTIRYKYAGKYYTIDQLVAEFGDPGLTYHTLYIRLINAGYNSYDTIDINDSSKLFTINSYRMDKIKPIHFKSESAESNNSSVTISFSNLNNTELP